MITSGPPPETETCPVAYDTAQNKLVDGFDEGQFTAVFAATNIYFWREVGSSSAVSVETETGVFNQTSGRL